MQDPCWGLRHGEGWRYLARMKNSLTGRFVSVTLSTAAFVIALWTSGAAADCKDLTLAVIDAAATSLEAHPTQAIEINVSSFSGNGPMTAEQNIGGGSGNVHVGEVTGFKAGAVDIDGAQTAKVQADSRAKSEQTVKVLKEIRGAVEKGEKSKAEGLLSQLSSDALDVVKAVVTAAVMKWLKVG